MAAMFIGWALWRPLGRELAKKQPGGGRERLQPLGDHAVTLDRRGLLGALAGAQPQRDDRPLHRAARGGREPRQPPPAAAIPRPASSSGLWFADSDIYKVLEAIGWETGRAGDARLGRVRRRRRRAAARGAGRGRLPQLVDPGRAARAALAAPRGEPRALLRRAPDPGRRRGGARRRARRPARRSPAASPTSPSGASARRAGSPVSTATRRSRRRSSSSPGTRATSATSRWPRRWSSGAATACSATQPSGRSTCRTTRRCARRPSRSATRCASSTSRPA